MFKQKKTNLLLSSYRKLPLWGKIALPAAGIFLVVSLYKALSWAFFLSVGALLLYVIASFVLYLKDKRKR
jgi:hypothetical protein